MASAISLKAKRIPHRAGPCKGVQCGHHADADLDLIRSCSFSPLFPGSYWGRFSSCQPAMNQDIAKSEMTPLVIADSAENSKPFPRDGNQGSRPAWEPGRRLTGEEQAIWPGRQKKGLCRTS